MFWTYTSHIMNNYTIYTWSSNIKSPITFSKFLLIVNEKKVRKVVNLHILKVTWPFFNIWWIVFSLFLKTLLFRSFHKTQTQHNQIIYKKDQVFACHQRSQQTEQDDPEGNQDRLMAIQDLTRLGGGGGQRQERNKWWVISKTLQSVTHNIESWEIMSRVTKLSLVSNLFWRVSKPK